MMEILLSAKLTWMMSTAHAHLTIRWFKLSCLIYLEMLSTPETQLNHLAPKKLGFSHIF